MVKTRLLVNFKFVPVLVALFLSVLEKANTLDTHQWNFLIFTQSWPITTCQEWKEKNNSHQCEMPLRENGWTIHGIWPTRKGSIGPNYCNRTWTFDPEQIKPIETVLNEYWKNIEKGTPLYELWAHEWAKHGTCAAVLDTLNTEYKYFKQGLYWTDKYPINEFLANSGITPSQDKLYPLSDINMAIKSKIGVDPIIECHKKSGTNYIAEIRICFDKNLQLADCEGVLKMGFFEDSYYSNFGDGVLSNCDRLEGVAYLPRLPQLSYSKEHLWFVQLYKMVNWLQWFTL